MSKLQEIKDELESKISLIDFKVDEGIGALEERLLKGLYAL
jgi:hypothetical protein